MRTRLLGLLTITIGLLVTAAWLHLRPPPPPVWDEQDSPEMFAPDRREMEPPPRFRPFEAVAPH